MATHYEILGVPETATFEDIKDAYRRQAMKWHPDRNPNNKEEAEEKFKQIGYAYKILSVEGLRREYDQWLSGQRTQSEKDESRDRAEPKGMSGEEAEKQFYEQMLDVAFELARRGHSESTIAETLFSFNCPKGIAEAVASAAARNASAQKRSPENSPLGAIENVSWDMAMPYYTAVIGGVHADDRMSEDRYLTVTQIRRSRYILLISWSVALGTILWMLFFGRSSASFAQDLFVGAFIGALIGFLAAMISLMVLKDRKLWLRENTLRYYLIAFESYHNARPLPFKFNKMNTAAFFVTFFWMAYRRMPGYALLGALIAAIVCSILILIEIDSPGAGKSMNGVGIGLGVGIGAVANKLYFWSARARIRKAQYLPKEQALRRLRETGGTNEWSWGGFLLLFVAFLMPAGIYQSEIEDQRAAVSAQRKSEVAARQKAEADAREAAANVETEKQVSLVIADIEARYPQFNSRDQRYDPKLVEEALRRQKVYIDKGMAPADALRRGVSDMAQEATAARAQRR